MLNINIKTSLIIIIIYYIMTDIKMKTFLDNYNDNNNKNGFKLCLDEVLLDGFNFTHQQKGVQKYRLTKKVDDYSKNPEEDTDITTKLLMCIYNLYMDNKYLKRTCSHQLGLSNINIQPKLVDIQTEEIKSFEVETFDTPQTIKKEVDVIPPTKEFLDKYNFGIIYKDEETIVELKLNEDSSKCEVYIQTYEDHPTQTRIVSKGINKGKEIPVKIKHQECIGYAYFRHKSQVARNHQKHIVNDILYIDDVPALFITIDTDPKYREGYVLVRRTFQSYTIKDKNIQPLNNEEEEEGVYIYEN